MSTSEYRRQYYLKNKEKINQKAKEYYQKNRDKIKEQVSQYYQENKEARDEYREEYRKANPAKEKVWKKRCAERNPETFKRRQDKRRSLLKHARPAWLSEFDLFVIREAKSLAKVRTKVTGIDWHTDHIVPIVSDIVCGLDVPWNIQVIPAKENLKKSNNFIELVKKANENGKKEES